MPESIKVEFRLAETESNLKGKEEWHEMRNQYTVQVRKMNANHLITDTDLQILKGLEPQFSFRLVFFRFADRDKPFVVRKYE